MALQCHVMVYADYTAIYFAIIMNAQIVNAVIKINIGNCESKITQTAKAIYDLGAEIHDGIK